MTGPTLIAHGKPADTPAAAVRWATTPQQQTLVTTLAELPRIVEVREAVVALGKQLGFTYVAVDLAGFRSGSLNEVLPAETLVQLKRR